VAQENVVLKFVGHSWSGVAEAVVAQVAALGNLSDTQGHQNAQNERKGSAGVWLLAGLDIARRI
jgi:hypothetical protein